MSFVGRLASSLNRRLRLALTLARTEFRAAHARSWLGRIWPWLQPLLMLLVYVLVFGAILRLKWGHATDESLLTFAIGLFAGLSLHGFMADVLGRAPSLVLEKADWVRKIAFPVDILPLVALIRAAMPLGASLLILIVAQWLDSGRVDWHWILIPIVLLPFLLLVAGLAWMLAALGVYIRDLQPLIPPLMTMMLFLAPVFYPLDSVPEELRWLIQLNPLTWPIESLRQLLMFGQLPDPIVWSLWLAATLMIAWLGYRLFRWLEKGFIDVL